MLIPHKVLEWSLTPYGPFGTSRDPSFSSPGVLFKQRSCSSCFCFPSSLPVLLESNIVKP